MSLFGSWMEREWWWNGWWMKRVSQHWCHWYLWWSGHQLVGLEAIHMSSVKTMSGNKMAKLLTTPKPSWTYSKEKESFCDCWRSLGLFIPLIATSATFFCGDGSNSKFEESSPCPLMTSRQQWKISMWQYWTNTSAQQQQLSRSGERRFFL